MSGKRRIVVIVAALLIGAAVVPLAGANGPMGGTENVNLTLPADGSGTATRAPMPASSTTGAIAVTTKSDDDAFFNKLTTVLSGDKPTFGARAVHCVLIYASMVNGEYQDYNDVTEKDDTLADLFLHVCLRLALSLSQQNGAASAPHAAGAATTATCGMRYAAVPVTITKTSSGYQATLNGTPHTAKPPRLRGSCTHTKTGLKITEKARKRGGKISRATGPILGVGFSSTSNSAGKLKIALGVR